MLSVKEVIKAWDNFFFAPKPVDSIAIFRIFWCSVLFLALILDLGNINDFYGPHALISLRTVKEQFQFTHANIFHLFNSSYEAVYFIMGLYGLSLFFAICGLYTRTSLITALICMTSLHQRNIWLLSSSELLMRLITLYLVFSPCGHAYSIDSLLGRKFASFKKPREWSPWALRLIQIQISVIYLWTVWHKLKGTTWMDGSALYYATRLESMKNFSLPFLLDSVIFLKLMTWTTIVVELGLGVLIWFKEFRRPVILTGIFFHIGIEYVMSIPFFEWIMICLLALFFTPEEYQSAYQRLTEKWIQTIKSTNMTDTVKEKFSWVLRG